MSNDYGFDSVFEGALEQEVAEPADDDIVEEETEETEGRKEQEVADPAEEEGQSAEENAKYAAARRKAEQERDLAIQRARDEVTETISAMGLIDPNTGKAITDLEGLKAYKDSIAAEQARQNEERLEELGLTKEDIDHLINAHPEVRQASEERARLRVLEQQEREAQIDRIFAEEIEKIQEFDPSVKDIGDLQENENREQMEAMIGKGYSISDAYYLANKDAIIARQVEAARQETRNNVASKGHLDKSSSRGKGSVEIPSDILSEFRTLNPNATDEEIQRFYERDLKRTKKG